MMLWQTAAAMISHLCADYRYIVILDMHTPKMPLVHVNSEHRENIGRWLKAGSIGEQVGVHLSKDLMTIAGRSLKANITTLGPLVLPFSEQLLFLANLVSRKVRPLPLMCIVDAHVFL